ncbi:hypothetical protein [Anaerophaga thermohalophila]|uniref:hypothetical protein n=1 Tax=Anaerophaga thermohalophila TaxID=177400 RepID=UPI000305B932|nr:hypothetical protein [Anaerophaga thermohalophila]
MVGKSKKKLISSLSLKKYRDKTGLFVAEGTKLVNDLLDAGINEEIILTTDSNVLKSGNREYLVDVVDSREIKQVSFLKTPQKILAVIKKT